MSEVNIYNQDCDCGAKATEDHDPKCAREKIRVDKKLAEIADWQSKNVAIYNQDCITGMAERLVPESVHLVVTSIPFGALFMYSGKISDIGNNADGTEMREGQFGLHMRFFIEQLFRVMRPGCNVCIHIQQLLRYKNQHGYMGRRDFRGAVVDLFGAGGFQWIGETVIPKNPQVIAHRLSLHSLQFASGRRNARILAPAVNDMFLIFQKPGECETPVCALHCPERNPKGWVTQEEWIRDAHGVWNDIEETDVLEKYRTGAKETEEEKHVCPLQLSPIARFVKLYSNPGELVMDPFMGIGSTACVCRGCDYLDMQRYKVAAVAPRRVVGFELKTSYYDKALRYLSELDKRKVEEAKERLF